MTDEKTSITRARLALHDEITASAQLIVSRFDEAATRFETQPDDLAAEQIGRAAWSLCERLRGIVLEQEPPEEWAETLAAIESLKDTAREWIDFAQERQTAVISPMRRSQK